MVINTRISLLEKLIFLLLLLIIPVHLIIILSFNVGSIDEVNYYFITSFVIMIIFILSTVIQLIFKRPYLPLLLGCHQKWCRSFKSIHKCLGICARCSGILLGIIITPLISILPFNKLYVLIGLVPLIIDGSLQKYKNYESNHTKRLITGLLSGPGMVLLIAYFHFYMAKLMLYLLNLMELI